MKPLRDNGLYRYKQAFTDQVGAQVEAQAEVNGHTCGRAGAREHLLTLIEERG